MKIAKVNVGAPVYVPAGGYLDGAVLDSPAWAHKGSHTLEAGFAQAQEQNGMLEIVSIDGAPVVWDACCGDH